MIVVWESCRLTQNIFLVLHLCSQTAKVVATQASMTVSYYITDQLETEMKTEERVKKGEISADEADKLNEEWEEVSTVVNHFNLAMMDVSKDRC